MSLFQSSLFKKLLMALTGIFLSAFLIVHALGNTQLFKHDQGYAFNYYAHFMSSNFFIKFISFGLYFLILVHIVVALALSLSNRKARKNSYASFKGSRNSSFASRNMGILGTIILLFLVVHMGDFWFKYKFGHVPYISYVFDYKTDALASAQELSGDNYTFQTIDTPDGRIVTAKNLYKQVESTFSQLPFVLVYLLSMVALGFHLLHGFQSAFKTLGLANKKGSNLVRFIGIWIYAILIPVLYASMPLYFYFKSI